MTISCDAHITQLDKPVGFGLTQPLNAVLRKGNQDLRVIVKSKGNPEGIKVLINEYTAYLIACECNVPMPPSGIAVIDEETECKDLASPNDLGTCFFSSFIKAAISAKPQLLRKVVNKHSYETIILFDFLINNRDRHQDNLIVGMTKDSKKLYAIDHTHAFKNGAIWDRRCLELGMEEKDYLEEDLVFQPGYEGFFSTRTITSDSLRKTAQQLSSSLGKELFRASVDKLPHDWNLDEKDANALVEYLDYRRSHLFDYCDLVAKKRGLEKPWRE